MDDEHSAHKEQVNIAQQSDKDAVVEVIPSTSAKNQVRSFIIIYQGVTPVRPVQVTTLLPGSQVFFATA